MTTPTYSTLTIRLSQEQYEELAEMRAEIALWAKTDVSIRDTAEGIIIAALVARQVERAAQQGAGERRN